uniref:Uncharacterized protein n=1 Tax=Knipowitschia caucasica TaxID=637954 RepID=A0AAV2M3W2_KNICA
MCRPCQPCPSLPLPLAYFPCSHITPGCSAGSLSPRCYKIVDPRRPVPGARARCSAHAASLSLRCRSGAEKTRLFADTGMNLSPRSRRKGPVSGGPRVAYFLTATVRTEDTEVSVVLISLSLPETSSETVPLSQPQEDGRSVGGHEEGRGNGEYTQNDPASCFAPGRRCVEDTSD